MPSAKFNPKYKIRIQYPPEPFINANGEISFTPSSRFLEIGGNITIEFDIKKSIAASVCSADFSIYNLNTSSRANLVKDRFDQNGLYDDQNFRKVIFEAAYGSDKLTTVFVGNLIEGYSERRGTEMVTVLNCFDAGINTFNKFSNVSVEQPFSLRDLISSLIKPTGLSIGFISDPEMANPIRGIALSGNSLNSVKDYFGVNTSYIDNNEFIFLNENDVLDLPVISIPEGNLLGTPRKQQTILITDVLFEPSIRMGQAVEIKSSVDRRFNGQYKVLGVHHTGIISPTVAGSRKTNLTLRVRI